MHEWLKDIGRAGHSVSVGAVGALALRPHRGAARRWGERSGAGNGGRGIRGHSTPGVEGDGGSCRSEVAAKSVATCAILVATTSMLSVSTAACAL